MQARSAISLRTAQERGNRSLWEDTSQSTGGGGTSAPYPPSPRTIATRAIRTVGTPGSSHVFRAQAPRPRTDNLVQAPRQPVPHLSAPPVSPPRPFRLPGVRRAGLSIVVLPGSNRPGGALLSGLPGANWGGGGGGVWLRARDHKTCSQFAGPLAATGRVFFLQRGPGDRPSVAPRAGDVEACGAICQEWPYAVGLVTEKSPPRTMHLGATKVPWLRPKSARAM